MGNSSTETPDKKNFFYIKFLKKNQQIFRAFN